MEIEGIDNMILPDGTPAKEGVHNLRSIIMEAFEDDVLIMKINRGIHISQETAEQAVLDAVNDIFGEGTEINGNENFKVASKDKETLVFYIYNPFEDDIIWERPDEEEE